MYFFLTHTTGALPPYSYIGFGAGIHTCMGESFAFMQIRTILAVMLSTYHVEMKGTFPQADYDAMVVMPKGKNLLTFTPRTDQGSFESLPSTTKTTTKTTTKMTTSSSSSSSSKAATSMTSMTSNKAAKSTTTSTSTTGKVDSNAFSDETMEKFTMKEIAKHDNKDDLWIVVEVEGIRGVYDVTTYLPVHQGGDALLKWGGMDATTAVSGPQHPSTVWRLLSRYKIGVVVDEVEEVQMSWGDLDSLL